ncbi:MAG: hypothetical protein ACI8RD_008148, partial [Bacillariaceae sp.]
RLLCHAAIVTESATSKQPPQMSSPLFALQRPSGRSQHREILFFIQYFIFYFCFLLFVAFCFLLLLFFIVDLLKNIRDWIWSRTYVEINNGVPIIFFRPMVADYKYELQQ